MVDLGGSAGNISSVLRKVLITAITGGIAYGITTVAQQDPTWSVTLSVLIGGVALVIQFLIDFEGRLQHLETSLQVTFHKVNAATELFKLLEESALQADVVTQLVRNAAQIKPNLPSLVHDLAQGELSRVSAFLKELSDGDLVTYDGEDRDWLLGLTRSVTKSINAVSMTTIDSGLSNMEGGLWSTDLGKRYLDEQGTATGRRGVQIRRLLVLDSGLSADADEVLRLCRKHQEVGVEVRTLEPGHAPAAIRTALFDFAVFDDTISYELNTGPVVADDGTPTIVSTRLVLQPARVASRARDFERLWTVGQPVPPPE